MSEADLSEADLSEADLSEADLSQLWASVFHARRTLNAVRLGARPVPDDLLGVIEELLAVVDRPLACYGLALECRIQRYLRQAMFCRPPVMDPHEHGHASRVQNNL